MTNLPNHSSRVISWMAEGNLYKISVTPPQMEFGNILRYASSVVQQATVTNVGHLPVKIGNITAAGDYVVSTQAPTFLLPGKQFLLSITFQPKRVGLQVGGVYVNSGDAAGTEFIKLLGRGLSGDNEDPGSDSGVDPQYWSWVTDGESKQFVLEGAEVGNKLFYDTAMEQVGGTSEFYVVPPSDFGINIGVDGAPSTIEFDTVPIAGLTGFTTLRGYAKPWTGPPPITQVGPRVITNITENNTVIDRTMDNTLILINSPTPFNLRIRKKAGVSDLNWRSGLFFSVMQVGDGPVTLMLQDGTDITPPLNYANRTRGKNAVISATCYNADGDQWVGSGDLLATASVSDKSVFTMTDRTVLLDSVMTVGSNKDSFHLPFGMKLDSIIDGGLFATLMTAQTNGTIFTIDVLRNDVSILVNKLLINNNQKTSKTSVTPASFVAGGDILAASDEITFSITQVGNGTARGLRLYLVGQRVQ